jgi:secondary thiamine-phosphate synthase enzyme
MASDPLSAGKEAAGLTACTERLRLRTRARVEFVDVTEAVERTVRRSGVAQGLVCIQTQHTTTAVVVNENEPGLLEDMVDVLERLVPKGGPYRHDDLARRIGVPPDEPANADAHCKAIFLSASQTLTVDAGRLLLGRWQRIFLVELDGGRVRTVSVTVLGAGPRGRVS